MGHLFSFDNLFLHLNGLTVKHAFLRGYNHSAKDFVSVWWGQKVLVAEGIYCAAAELGEGPALS
jgi:hypothetical protein